MTRRNLNACLLAILACAAAAAVVEVLHAAGRAAQLPPPASSVIPPSPLRFCLALQVPSALAFVAAERFFFEQQFLDVELQTEVSGKRALEALRAGRCDVATTADVPVAIDGSSGDIVILAQISSSRISAAIVARADAVRRPSDLQGKRIGTQAASAIHYFLDAFASSHGLSAGDFDLRFMDVEKLAPSFEAGALDAVVLREPYLSAVCSRLRDRIVVFKAPGLYTRAELVVASRRFVSARPDAVCGLLRALVRGEVAVRAAPHTSLGMVARRLGVAPETLCEEWNAQDFTVGLDQTLLIGLEDEARWARRCGLVPRRAEPNFLKMIWSEGLSAVDADRVTVIH